MALDTYTGLVEAIGGWLNRGTTLDARIPDFIRLTESRLNKILDDPEMEVTSTATSSGQYLALPSDFGELRTIRIGNYRLSQNTAADFSGFSTSVGGIPRVYSISDGQLAFAPIPATGSGVSITYIRRVPALTATAPTNWMLSLAPEVYLYGSLLAAEGYLMNDERLPMLKSAYEEAIGDLRADASRRRWGAAPLAPRIRRT